MKTSLILPTIVLGAASLVMSTSALATTSTSDFANHPIRTTGQAAVCLVGGVLNATGTVITGVARGTGQVITDVVDGPRHHTAAKKHQHHVKHHHQMKHGQHMKTNHPMKNKSDTTVQQHKS